MTLDRKQKYVGEMIDFCEKRGPKFLYPKLGEGQLWMVSFE